MNKWLKEKFLGLPVTWGDDRALTNWALRLDYFTIFSDDVEAYTVVPNNFKQFLKQQIRWKKGWFVNSVFATRFIMKKDPFVDLSKIRFSYLPGHIPHFILEEASIFEVFVRGEVVQEVKILVDRGDRICHLKERVDLKKSADKNFFRKRKILV